MITWFTADTHFGHTKIIEHSKRPFASVEEMDDVITQRWNAVVKQNDDVWHLGDFNYRSKRLAGSYRLKLNGRIHVVWGNHDDKYAKKYPQLFSTVQDVKYLKLNDEKITLYHYAQRVWRNSQHGAWHLFGHSHGHLGDYNRSMDVGVDAHDFTPISFEQVREHLKDRPITLHHIPATIAHITV